MKKLLLIAAVVVFGLTSVNAQQNVIKVNPLGLAFGSTELSYERALSDNSSVELALAYSSSDVTFSTGEVDATGFGAEGKYKFFFSSSNDAPRGWYAAPVFTYASTTAESGSSKGDLSYFGGGAVAGYQWIFGGGDTGFALDLNLGAQYISAKTGGDIISASIDGVLPRLGLSLGYAW